MGAITVDALSSMVDKGTKNPVTWSHTVGGGVGRLLIVGTSNKDGDNSVTSVTCGGRGLTQAGFQAGPNAENRVSIWFLLAPEIGTANVVVTLSKKDKVVLGTVSFTGVDQRLPVGEFASAFGISANPSVFLNSASDEILIDVLAADGNASGATADADQTRCWNLKTGTGHAQLTGGGSTKPGINSLAMSWTLDDPKPWIIGATALKPLPFADIATTQTGPASAFAVSDLTYSITVTNLGPNTSSNVIVSDTLPDGVAFVSASGGGAVSNGIVYWTIASLPTNATTNFTLIANTRYSGVLTCALQLAPGRQRHR